VFLEHVHNLLDLNIQKLKEQHKRILQINKTSGFFESTRWFVM